jgi:hypothetical protein
MRTPFAGMGVQFILFMGIEVGVGVLLARRCGLWKRLRAAPLSRATLLGSHILSGALTALILLAIIYAAAIGIFKVRIDGSVPASSASPIAFALLTSSFGLLIAAIGKTPEATRGLAIFATLIMVMLGGAWVPSFVFPQWLQTASLVVPTRWAVDGLDAMTWRGLGFDAAVGPIVACSSSARCSRRSRSGASTGKSRADAGPTNRFLPAAVNPSRAPAPELCHFCAKAMSDFRRGGTASLSALPTEMSPFDAETVATGFQEGDLYASKAAAPKKELQFLGRELAIVSVREVCLPW